MWERNEWLGNGWGMVGVGIGIRIRIRIRLAPALDSIGCFRSRELNVALSNHLQRSSHSPRAKKRRRSVKLPSEWLACL